MITLTNISQEIQDVIGTSIDPGSDYEVPEYLEEKLRADSKLIYCVENRLISVSDGFTDTAGSEGVAILNRHGRDNVITEYEKNDKVPKYAKASGTFDGNGVCVISVKIPGDFSPMASRLMSLAYFIEDVFGWGDAVTKIEITDDDNILGAGSGYVVTALHDTELNAANQGWYFYPSHGGTGEIEITPPTNFGEINGGLYIKATIVKAPASLATKVLVNLDWGAWTS